MRSLRILVALLGLLPGASSPGASSPVGASLCPPTTAPETLHLPRASAALRAGDRLVIVAIGSSSTEGSHATAPARTYPAKLQTILTRALPGTQVTVINKGIGGQDAADTMARFDRDAIAHSPAIVIWQVGANGALRDVDPGDFAALVGAGIARLRAAGIDVVLMDNQRAPQILRHPRRVAIERALAEQAVLRGVGLFSRGALMDGWAAAGHPNAAFLAPDGLHHNDRGYACVAEALAGAILAGVVPPVMGPPLIQKADVP